ncbi:MAG: ATP-binding protein [Desulfobacterales bacterium]|nr:ATP-binding protein [Desulfobacterales bacterium]
MDDHLEPIEDFVGELFVDRHEELEMCRKWVNNIPRRHLNSFALLGRRRTGKTAILVKFFNELFWNQDRVIPVFISFSRYLNHKEPITYYDFARVYFTDYLKSYLAFRHREPLLMGHEYDFNRLRSFAGQAGDEYAVDLCEHYEDILAGDSVSSTHDLVQWVINFPMSKARSRKMPTAIIIDEFQILTNVLDPKQNVHHDLTDSFQRASETKWAPLLISGSAVTLLVEEALGGLLSGRIRGWHLKPMGREYIHDLVFRMGEIHGISVNEEFAEAVWQLAGGYPYSVVKLLNSQHPAAQNFPSLDALEAVMFFEMTNTSGELWQHYDREFRKYSDLLNTGKVTKKVMFWTTKYPEERIDAKRIAVEIGVSMDDVQDSLHKLQQADILIRIGWTLYQGPGDPMLRRYIEYNYHQEIEELSHAESVKNWEQEYKQLRGRMSNFIGEVAEVYIEAVLRAFDNREVDGASYFNTTEKVKLPVFEKIERRGGIVKGGIPIEIDLTGEWTDTPGSESGGKNRKSAWLVQVKYTSAPVGKSDIRQFLEQTGKVAAEKKYANITQWYFAKKGYTASAEQCLQQAGVLHSTLGQFNALAKLVGFFGLPE